jgi:CubicO group peptidase (beta-lactamase class C family)
VTPFSEAAAVLERAIGARAFPAASVEVGRHDGPLWTAAIGTLTYEADSPQATPATVFDLASLTKVVATTTLAMRAVDEGRLALDGRVADWLRDWRGADREAVTIRDLLTHASGLTAYLPFFRDYTGRPEFERAICTMPLEYPPRSQALYSDLGFILLGFILEDARQGASSSGEARSAKAEGPGSQGVRLPVARSAKAEGPGDALGWDPATTLAAQFHRIAAYFTAEPLTFNPPRAWRPHTAPTELDTWRGRLLVGEVHDENAWALGGAAGHAGLFGTAAAVGAFARVMLLTLRGADILAKTSTAREFIRPTGVAGSSRALGWDTMRPTSSCGTRMSPTAIGHTGFTGTSLWIDWERDLYVVLLTNRVHPTRDNHQIRAVRRAFHDAVVSSLTQG